MKNNDYKITDIGDGIKTFSPDVNYFIQKLENGESFSFLRANHASFDSISPYISLDFLNSKLSEKDYVSIAYEIYKKSRNNQNSHFYRWYTIDENFIHALSIFYKILHSYNGENDKLEFGISLDNGIFNFKNTDGSLTTTINYLKPFIDINKVHLSGGLVRHYAVTEEIFSFFDKLNELDYDVIIIGPPYLEMCKYVFNIKNFHIIPIGYVKSMGYIDLRVDMVKKLIKKKETIILNSTGHELSSYIYYRLRDVDCSQFDIGRGLDWNLNLAYKKGLFKEEFQSLSVDIIKPWIFTNENPWLEYDVEILLNNVNELRYNS